MGNEVQAVGTALSVVQLLQAGLALLGLAKDAVAQGKTEVSADEFAASLASNQIALDDLRAAIDRAKSEGR